jgi:hypothetical protein
VHISYVRVVASLLFLFSSQRAEKSLGLCVGQDIIIMFYM